MCNIIVGRYGVDSGVRNSDGSGTHVWQGWIEPKDKSWIAFIRADGSPQFFLNRDPETGAILDVCPVATA